MALIILMILWTPTLRCSEEFETLEFFAGRGNLSRCMRLSGRKTCSFDILYKSGKGRSRPYGSNAMDINSTSGYALCILALLCTKIRFLATYAIKCASWTAVNRGTSGRSACASIGHEGFASVDNSNTMASRTCLLCLLTTALGGTWAVEQPELSVLEYFPPFLALLTALYKAYGETAVYRAKWYMLHYGSLTPKPHYAWCNSNAIQGLNMGRLLGWKKRLALGDIPKVKTCETYKDKNGKTRYKGTAALRKTEEYPVRFGFKLVDLYDDLTTSSRGRAPFPSDPAGIPSAPESFRRMPEGGHALQFAQLDQVFNYLRRGKHMVIPNEWKDLVPKPK
ncbi:unnamed protein product [Cladocopium goreaui]|uniref:Uncharacterized protein n=1 Tax=Cladocopium goreaui TaxID=2562237 RepID=A0A9P1CL89_9DINO|nr:unnamed protein product [Cladocopium goreaui]